MDDLFTTDWSVLGLVQEQEPSTQVQHTQSQGRLQVSVAGARFSWKMRQEQLAPGSEWRQRLSEANRVAWQDPVTRENRSAGIRASWADPVTRENRSAGLRASWVDPVKRANRMAGILGRHRLRSDYPSVVTPAGEFWTWGEAERAMGICGHKRRKLQQQHPELYYIKGN